MSGNLDRIRSLEAQRSIDETLRRMHHEVYGQWSNWRHKAAQEPVGSYCVIDPEGVQRNFDALVSSNGYAVV